MFFATDPTNGRTRAAQPSVAPDLPLALLEAIRARDRPREVLEEEDVVAALPRRLGLTGVVGAQIRRYERAKQTGSRVPADDACDLLRLILKRPDSDATLREAGRRIAQRRSRHTSRLASAVLRLLPARISSALVRRAVQGAFGRIADPGTVACERQPLVLRIRDALTARADAGGEACALYTGALEELVRLHTGERRRMLHTSCGAGRGGVCEWRPADALSG